MKKLIYVLAALSLLFACMPEEINSGDKNGHDGSVHVTGISLDRPTVTIKEGESVMLIPTVTPDNATNKAVTWSTSSEAVATVDNNGKVTGVKAGSATITAFTEDGGKKATCALSVEANLAPSVTGEVNNLSAISAVLAGKSNLGTTVASDLTMGIMWSKNAGVLPSNSTKIVATNMDGEYNYSVGVTGLEPATTYYFRSYVTQNGQDTYGVTNNFTTKELSSLLATQDATEVEAASAKLDAMLDLTDVQYSTKEYGFYWGTSETTQNNKLNGGEIKDNAYLASLNNLSHKTQYWYKAYVKLDSQTFYGEVKTFTTDVVKVESVSLDRTEYTFNTKGNTLSLTATVFPANATDKSVEWTSSKASVATVDQNGIVSAKGNGTAIITVRTKDLGKTASCTVTVSLYVTDIILDKTILTLHPGENKTLSVTKISPADAYDKTYTWSSLNESVATVSRNGNVKAVSVGSTQIHATANDGSGVYANCVVTVKQPYHPTAGAAIDLGLSVKWSNCNLGATKPEEHGDYFAWGETFPKDNYSWASYELCNGSSSSLTKYNTGDGKTVLDLEDDAARHNLGGNWRMPTDEEWTELRTHCGWTWKSENGVNGCKVTGQNGNSIFLPGTGYKTGSKYNYGNNNGFYWSSSLFLSANKDAYYYQFYYIGFDRKNVARDIGLSIRPVCVE